MTADMTDDLSPAEAVQTLTEIEGYDEKLTARAFGLTLMVFAFAIAAIPISYAAADPWLAAYEYGSLVFGALWMPWVVAAVAATTMIWSTHSITLGEASTTINQWLMGIGFTILFLSVAAGVSIVLGPDATNYGVMGIAGGLFTILIGIVFYRLYRARWVLFSLFVTGVAIVLVTTLLNAIGFSSPDAGFTVTGFVQGTAYFVTGWITALRG